MRQLLGYSIPDYVGGVVVQAFPEEGGYATMMVAKHSLVGVVSTLHQSGVTVRIYCPPRDISTN